MKATRRTIEFVRGASRLTLTSETVRSRGPQLVLNGDVWALEHKSWLGVRYEFVRPATRKELIEHSGMNVNPQTAAAVIRGQVTA